MPSFLSRAKHLYRVHSFILIVVFRRDLQGAKHRFAPPAPALLVGILGSFAKIPDLFGLRALMNTP